MPRGTSSLLLFALPLVVGCGGSVVFDEAGGQGGGGGGGPAASTTISGGATTNGPSTNTADASASVADVSASTGPTSGSGSVTTGPGLCESHDDCPGALCVFATGLCAVACAPFNCDACAAGEVCDECATSSCPQCDDCIAACQPTPAGRCDDNDPCPGPDEVCLLGIGSCAPSCEALECADPNMVCNDCATSSCCGCADCVGACQGLEQ